MKTTISTLDRTGRIAKIVIGTIIGTAAVVNLCYQIGRLIGNLIAPLL